MYTNEALTLLGCCYSSLRGWGNRGKIRRFKNDRGHWVWNDDDVYALIGKRVSRDSLVTVYCRVAGTGTRDRELMADQQRVLHSWCAARGLTVDRMYEDWERATEYSLERRPGLHLMLQDIIQRNVSAVIVETPDRLARIGREMIEEICRYYGVQLIYLNKVIQRPEYLAEQEKDLALLLEKAKVDRLDQLGVETLPRPKKVKLQRPGKIVADWDGQQLPPNSRDLSDLI